MRAPLLRHLTAILLLPFVVVVVVPQWLLRAYAHQDVRWGTEATLARLVLGAVLCTAGLAMFAWCVRLFARVGRGTLAPWDPTRALVTLGPYAYVRNPMISGVAAMLAGQAVAYGSLLLAAWLLLFVLVNHAYFLLSEEPGLRRRFGASYDAYRARVPRWVPRAPRARPRPG